MVGCSQTGRFLGRRSGSPRPATCISRRDHSKPSRQIKTTGTRGHCCPEPLPIVNAKKGQQMSRICGKTFSTVSQDRRLPTFTAELCPNSEALARAVQPDSAQARTHPNLVPTSESHLLTATEVQVRLRCLSQGLENESAPSTAPVAAFSQTLKKSPNSFRPSICRRGVQNQQLVLVADADETVAVLGKIQVQHLPGYQRILPAGLV